MILLIDQPIGNNDELHEAKHGRRIALDSHDTKSDRSDSESIKRIESLNESLFILKKPSYLKPWSSVNVSNPESVNINAYDSLESFVTLYICLTYEEIKWQFL